MPALNELLEPFGIELGDFVGEGEFDMDGHAVYFASGTMIKTFPATGRVARKTLLDQGAEVLHQEGQERQPKFRFVRLFFSNAALQLNLAMLRFWASPRVAVPVVESAFMVIRIVSTVLT